MKPLRWADVKAGLEAGTVEERQLVGERMRNATSRMGRSSVDVECPFCRALVTVYLWSFAPSGKRCRCGALLGASGCYKRRS